jgi:hypothetical protein
MNKIDRLQFLQLAGSMLGVGVAAACGGDDTSAPAGPACDTTPPQATIQANHGHVLTVTAADAKAAMGMAYNIQGTATHNHKVNLTNNDFQTMEAGSTVYVVSEPGGTDLHTHSITIICG